MKDKDSRLIWESYKESNEFADVLKAQEYYRTHGHHEPVEPVPEPPKKLMVDWETDSGTIYRANDWNMRDDNPYNQYVAAVLDDLRGEDADTYVVFFGPKEGSPDYEQWTDPSVVIAVEIDRELEDVSTWSEPIFVDNDGEGESRKLSDDHARDLISNNHKTIMNYAQRDDNTGSWDPYGPEGVVNRRDFY